MDQGEGAAGVPDFRAIYDAELEYVWNALRRFGVRGHDLEDLTQEVFVKAFQRWPSYDPRRPLRPWLFGIAFRLATDFKRLARHAREVGEDEGPDVVDDARGPHAAIEAQQAQDLVLRALQKLERDRWAVFVMHELDGHAVPEIALALEIPLNTAYSRLRLARSDFTAAVRRLQGGEA